MQIAHKIELKPNNKQRTYFKKACGVARHSWNWGLDQWNFFYKLKTSLPKEAADEIKISGMKLKKDFNAIKKIEFPWTGEVTKYAAQQPFIQLQSGWKRFFSGLGGKPKFKKKGQSTDSFYIGGDQVKVKDKKIWVPNLGYVRLKESLRFDGKINSATFSRSADRWFVSVQIKMEEIKQFKKDKSKKATGVDLGISKMIVLSDGSSFDSPKPLKNNLRKLKRQQRQIAKKIRAAKRDKRKLRDTKNFQKQKNKIAKTHFKITNIRKDTIHKVTSFITTNFSKIAIEDLHVKGMVKNHKLARAISDIGFGEIRRQLEYKSSIRGNTMIVADRFFPSSKTCSSCSKIKNKDELKLSDRVFKCECGLELDRDLNAAINLEKLFYLNKKVRPVRSKLTPVEITAMQKSVFPTKATSIIKSGSKLQTG